MHKKYFLIKVLSILGGLFLFCQQMYGVVWRSDILTLTNYLEFTFTNILLDRELKNDNNL